MSSTPPPLPSTFAQRESPRAELAPRMACPAPYSNASRKRAFLLAFAQTGNIARAARSVPMDRANHYDWLREDEEYREAFKEAQRQAADLLEDEAERRAVQGLKRYKFTKNGDPIYHPTLCECGAHRSEHHVVTASCARTGCLLFRAAPYVEHEYSDTLLSLLLKGRKREVFADKLDANVNVTGGVLLVPAPVDPDSWAAAAAAQQRLALPSVSGEGESA